MLLRLVHISHRLWWTLTLFGRHDQARVLLDHLSQVAALRPNDAAIFSFVRDLVLTCNRAKDMRLLSLRKIVDESTRSAD